MENGRENKEWQRKIGHDHDNREEQKGTDSDKANTEQKK